MFYTGNESDSTTVAVVFRYEGRHELQFQIY